MKCTTNQKLKASYFSNLKVFILDIKLTQKNKKSVLHVFDYAFLNCNDIKKN